MSFVPCCKCGNISIVAPLHRVLKNFVKRTAPHSQSNSMNISDGHMKDGVFENSKNSSNCNDLQTNICESNLFDNSDSKVIQSNCEYVNITESPVLALAIPQNSIFIREIEQIRFANDKKQFPEIDEKLIIENEANADYGIGSGFISNDKNNPKGVSDDFHNCTVSLVVKSVFMKCSKCGAIFVINFTRRNSYLCRLASGAIKSSPLKDTIPINDDIPSTFNSSNSNNNQPRLPPRAAIRSFTSSPFVAQRQIFKNKASIMRNRQLISSFVPVFVMPLICGCGNTSELAGVKHVSSNPITNPHPGSAPTVDPTIREKRIKRSYSLGPQKPWNKISNNDDESKPTDNSNVDNNVDNTQNNDLFPKSNDSNGLIRNKYYGSDGDTLFSADWPDTDFEFMFSAKDDIPFEFKTNVFL